MDVVTRSVGHPFTVPVLAALVAGLYLVGGLNVANFAISVVTLALLPVLQHSQNRDGAALQAKLDAMIRAIPEAPNRLIAIERRTEEEIAALREQGDA